MTTSRLEAFTDAVLAIIITIMVLELKAPDGTSLQDLWESTGTGPRLYLLTFVYVGIYWNNHHHRASTGPRRLCGKHKPRDLTIRQHDPSDRVTARWVPRVATSRRRRG